MKTKIQLFAAFLLLAVGALWLTSCSSEDAVQGSGNTESERVLLLSISTGQTAVSRTETDLNSDEQAIEDMTIGIFDANGNVRTIQSLTKGGANTSATAGSGQFVINGTKAEAKIVTTGLKVGDQVVVAVNATTNSAIDNAATFKAAKSVADFNKGYIDATSALTAASNGTTLSAAKLPKYGVANLTTGSNSSEFRVDVKVKNLVSRVTLADLKPGFDTKGPYKDASFNLSDIFLLNVPNTVDFSKDAWTAQTVTYIHGSDTYNTDNTANNYKSFLTKAATNSDVDGNDKPYLYTLPNGYTASNKQKTILVLKGTFTKPGGATSTVYYPLALNAKYNNEATDGTAGTATAVDGTIPFVTYPGRNYKCNVTIKTIGSDSPWQEAGPLTATVDVEVEKWTDVEQNTTFK